MDTGSTADYTLIRKDTVGGGETDWSKSEDEWDVYPKDDMSAWGTTHHSKCGFAFELYFPNATSNYNEDYSWKNPNDQAHVQIGISNWAHTMYVDALVLIPGDAQCRNTAIEAPAGSADFDQWNYDVTFPPLSGQDQLVYLTFYDDSRIEGDEYICYNLKSTYPVDENKDEHELKIIDNDASRINDLIKHSIVIYPTVIKTELFIEGEYLTNDMIISINNIIGQKVITLKPITNKMFRADVKNLEPGVYIVNILNDKLVYSRKFIKL